MIGAGQLILLYSMLDGRSRMDYEDTALGDIGLAVTSVDLTATAVMACRAAMRLCGPAAGRGGNKIAALTLQAAGAQSLSPQCRGSLIT